MNLPILYQDQEVVVINKPSGLLVHRSLMDRHATEFALQILRDQIGKTVYPVHRLDRATSGALIFALSKDTARDLGAKFAQGRIEKKYLAIVRGKVPEPVCVDYPLKEELDKKADVGVRQDKVAQTAITKILPLATCELPFSVDRYASSRYSLVQAEPQTGRKHQIRRHLRHVGHPIIGDINYGVGKHNRFFEEQFKIRRLLLACTGISFKHPISGQQICVKAPLAEDFSGLIDKLGWSTSYE